MVDILSISFKDEYHPLGTPSDYLTGSVLDKITAVVNLKVHWESLGISVVFDATAKTIKRADNLSWLSAGFALNDTFDIVNTTAGINDGTFTIASITPDTITVNETIPSSGVYSNVDFHGTTPVNAVDFYFNLIKNSDIPNFVSFTDGPNLQKKSAGKTTWGTTETVSLSVASQSQAWDSQTDITTGTAYKAFIVAYAQYFTITHTFYIAPLFLSGQQVNLSSLFSGTPSYPDYFKSSECLRYVCRLDARFSQNGPITSHSTDNDSPVLKNGNDGWFNEFLNANPAKYRLKSITYKDSITQAAVSRLNADKNVDVTILITSQDGFSLTKYPKMVLGILYCPLLSSDYQNTYTDLVYNYKYDRQIFTTGDAASNGERYGTDLQALTNITSAIITGDLRISFTVSLKTFMSTFIRGKASTDRNYLIYVTPEEKSITGPLTTDRNAVLCDFNNYDIITDNSSLINYPVDIAFYEYPALTTCAFTDYKGFIQDGMLSKIKLQVLKGGILTDLSVKIQAYNSSTGSSFDLETFSLNFSSKYSTDNEIVNPITQLRNFYLSTSDPRNEISFYRNAAIDTVNYFGYELDYGCKLRYETWRQVPQFDQAFTANHTEDWSIYSLASGWEVRFIVVANATNSDGSNPTEFDQIANMAIKNKSFSDDGFGGPVSITIETFSGTGQTYNGFIVTDGTTHVRAVINGNFASFPPIATGYYGILSLDVPVNGGYMTIQQTTNSELPVTGGLWLNQAVLTKKNNNEIWIEADIDETQLDLIVEKYLISCRFGFTGCVPPYGVLQTDDGIDLHNDDDVQIEVD